MSKSFDFKHLVDREATSPDLPLIVDFYGGYCPPCRLLEPVLARLAEKFRGQVQVVKVDIEEQPDLAQRYRVRSVPTLLALDGDNVVAQQVGFTGPRKVEEMFAALATRRP